jgi:hypothetical protein
MANVIEDDRMAASIALPERDTNATLSPACATP